MSFFARLLAALRALIAPLGRAAATTARPLLRAGSATGHALGDGARLLGRGARAVARDIGQVIPGEWKQRIALLFATGLAVVPIIYSGNMTWAFNDPTGHLNQITAAVVDADTGADSSSPDGTTEHIDVGREFTDELLDMDKNTVYRFVETDQATADAGLADGTYGAVIEVPADFSANIASLGADDPMQAAPAMLTVRTNDTINYVGGNFTKSVGTALRHSLEANVLDQYLDKIYIGFTTMHDKLGEAADGATRLHDGSVQLTDGTGQLVDGSADLADGAGTLADGTGDLADGAHRLSDGSYDLVIGLGQISTGADQLSAGADRLSTGATTLATGLDTLSSKSPELVDGADRLASGSAQLEDGAQTLADGSRQVADGTQQLDDAATGLQGRARELGIDQQSVDRTTGDLQTAVDDLAQTATDVNTALAGTGIAPQMQQNAQDLSGRIDTAASDAKTLQDAVAARQGDASTVQDSATTISDQVDTIADGVKTANDAAPQLAKHASDLDDATVKYTSTVDKLAALCAEEPSTGTATTTSSGASDGGGAETTVPSTPSEVCDRLQALAGDSASLRSDAGTVSQKAAANRDALAAVTDGAQQVRDSATAMKDSADRLATFLSGTDGSSSLTALAQDVQDLSTDAKTLAGDSKTVSDGVTRARDILQTAATDPAAAQQKIDDLHSQATTAVQALPDAYDRADQAVQDIHRLNSGAQQVADGNERLAGATGQLADGASTLDDGVRRYTGGVDQAAGGAGQLADGAQELSTGADRLASGVDTAEDGAQQLNAGAGQLADGADRIAAGATQLADGATRLHDGAVQVDDGAQQLADGSKELADGLGDAVDQVPSYTDTEREHLASTASDPVGLDFHRDNGLDRFGEGLAPLFLAISLWVGGMAIFLMMSPFSVSAARAGRNAGSLLLGGLLPAQALGLVQTVVAVAILHFWVGITAVHMTQFVLMACLTSIVFVALNHGFGAMFGPVGKFVALVLIALQVSGAGGTYPVQTLPRFFRVIHEYLPMTHAVDAFRGTIGGGWVDPSGDIAWLLGWLALGLVLGFGGALKTRRRARRGWEGHVAPTAS